LARPSNASAWRLRGMWVASMDKSPGQRSAVLVDDRDDGRGQHKREGVKHG
jgi:hypothetical protein